jgi:hypothetical protein
MPAAGEVVELVGMETEGVVGGEMKRDDAKRRTSIEKSSC